MTFVFPIDECLKKIDLYVSKNEYPRSIDINTVKSSIPKRYLTIVNETVDMLASMYLNQKFSGIWGIKPDAKRPLQYAKENVRRVIVSNNKKRSVCLNKFKDVRKIDSGSFATVYAATGKKNMRYAIKQISLDASLYDEIGAESIKRELEVTEMMGEIGAGPKMYDSFLCRSLGKPYVYIVLEYFNRKSLWDYTHEGNVIDEKNVKALAELVDKMHTNGIVHSDLHAGNILVHENPDGSLKFAIGDYGMAYFSRDVQEIERSKDVSSAFLNSMEVVAVTIRPLIWKLIRDKIIKFQFCFMK